jgi:hypothetical protein
MNAAPLEYFERWDIHGEGMQPSVRAIADALDAERIALREMLACAPPHFPLADHYTSERWMYGDAHQKLADSGDWREHIDLRTHRYMVEDTVLGLAFVVSVALWAGCDPGRTMCFHATALMQQSIFRLSPHYSGITPEHGCRHGFHAALDGGARLRFRRVGAAARIRSPYNKMLARMVIALLVPAGM